MNNNNEVTEEIVIVHWPGKDTPACPRHLKKLVGLSGIMGFQLSWTPGEDGLKCSNCESERKKREEAS